MDLDPSSLDRLHDIIVPPAVPWWPPAAGWYWLMGTLLAIGTVQLLRAFIRWQQNRYRREALAQWRTQVELLGDANARVSAVTALATLLKRTALSAFPRTEVASLTGPAWLAFLDRTAEMHGFNSNTGALLENAVYGNLSVSQLGEKEARDAASLVHQWIKHHRAPSFKGSSA
jgi:hypothetical protein